MSTHLPRFLIAAPTEVGARVELPPDEAAHARVRRLRLGEAVALFDGAGHAWIGRVAAVSRAGVAVDVAQACAPRQHESALDLTLAFGLLKSDRTEWLIEKATELGVSALRPFSSTHSLGDPSPNRRQRWQQIAAAAAKQCGRSVVPRIAEPVALATVLTSAADVALLLAEQGDGDDLLSIDVATPRTALLIVGAEGGFSGDELAAARAAGCRPIALGPRILRAETCAVAAAALVQARWGDLRGGPRS